MNIGKLVYSGAVTSDTCNAVRKTRRLLVDAIKNAAIEMNAGDIINSVILEVDCWHYFRNVWLGGMTKELSSFLREELQSELECIDTRL